MGNKKDQNGSGVEVFFEFRYSKVDKWDILAFLDHFVRSHFKIITCLVKKHIQKYFSFYSSFRLMVAYTTLFFIRISRFRNLGNLEETNFRRKFHAVEFWGQRK